MESDWTSVSEAAKVKDAIEDTLKNATLELIAADNESMTTLEAARVKEVLTTKMWKAGVTCECAPDRKGDECEYSTFDFNSCSGHGTCKMDICRKSDDCSAPGCAFNEDTQKC